MNASTTAPGYELQRSDERYFGDHGWLQTRHSFSFADYYDPQRMHWGALRVLNDDRVAPGQGFPTHPHRDMEIISYVLEGELEHRDSMGNHGIVTAGGVQYMSAGRGVRHSEFNASATVPVHFLQMWVPPRTVGIDPRYGQKNYVIDARRDRWLAIASGLPTVSADVELDRDAAFFVARVEAQPLAYETGVGRLGFLFVATGAVTAKISVAGGVAVTEALKAGDALRLGASTSFSLSGTAEVVFWDVPPLDD